MMKAISAARREELERELAFCEQHVTLLRELIALQPLAGQIAPLSRGPARPNAGMRRFIMETVRKRPGIGVPALTAVMRNMGFRGTPSRRLKQVVLHELRTLVRHNHVRINSGRVDVDEPA